MKTKKLATVSHECVACGCCAKNCPQDAITIDRGLLAVVDSQICIGCGKCAQICPGAIITLSERGMANG